MILSSKEEVHRERIKRKGYFKKKKNDKRVLKKKKEKIDPFSSVILIQNQFT